MSERNRKGRKAFTFWFDLELKLQLMERARKLGTTTTELMNHAVKVYIEQGYIYDEETSAKQSSMDIIKELEIANMVEDKISPIMAQLKGLSSRIERIEENSGSGLPQESIDELVRQKIRLTMLDKVNPILDQIMRSVTKLGLEEK